MIERIDKLLEDNRLNILEEEREFRGVTQFLLWAKDLVSSLSSRDKKYIEKIETHIQRINPHEEMGIVNGENSLIHYVTKKAR
jgi:hypothetical protein